MFQFKPRSFDVEGQEVFLRMLTWDEQRGWQEHQNKLEALAAEAKAKLDLAKDDIERLHIVQALEEAQEKPLLDAMVYLVSRSLTDEHGNQLFLDDDHKGILRQLPMKALHVVFALAKEHQKPTKDDVARARKN